MGVLNYIVTLPSSFIYPFIQKHAFFQTTLTPTHVSRQYKLPDSLASIGWDNYTQPNKKHASCFERSFWKVKSHPQNDGCGNTFTTESTGCTACLYKVGIKRRPNCTACHAPAYVDVPSQIVPILSTARLCEHAKRSANKINLKHFMLQTEIVA